MFAIAALAGWCLLSEMVARRRFSIRQLLAMTCCIAVMLGTYASSRSHNRMVQELPSVFLVPVHDVVVSPIELEAGKSRPLRLGDLPASRKLP